eukprot:CAMPEP_0206183264 /NCGR_PEP_ID=MMETSP0166-20121206/534_1 /ASSEMBLY_ACC=CAM_ASM_000260 /TAXON_ID=95228 /ORGANISM="Vannella robusta, Strain DIVA3 518/3/11/1/6" /LENGTH=256 /DNA_ID=CAMNT_0053598085 /DNA_START=424 /DNA_END=1190 /DNA_ORIENTATION=+
MVLRNSNRKKREKERRQGIEIPDFAEKSSLTLEDVLNDPLIPRLFWENITVGEAIGKGASGLVSKGTWNDNGVDKEIALKELLFGFQEEFGIEVLQDFLAEIKYMSALYHENVVCFYGISVSPGFQKLYLVTELMHFGSLRDVLDKKRNNLPWSMRLNFAKAIAKGMDYLHSKKLIHRDLKPDNILVNNDWTCKVADFGISTARPTITRQMTCIGTPIYMAPEVIYSEKADVFAFGMVLWEIFTGKLPYMGEEFQG